MAMLGQKSDVAVRVTTQQEDAARRLVIAAFQQHKLGSENVDLEQVWQDLSAFPNEETLDMILSDTIQRMKNLAEEDAKMRRSNWAGFSASDREGIERIVNGWKRDFVRPTPAS